MSVRFEMKDVLKGSQVFFIVLIGGSILPDFFRITILAKENESKVDKVEEYYRIKYSVEKIDSELIQKWKNCSLHEELRLPLKNEFIPSVFELKTPRQDWVRFSSKMYFFKNVGFNS